MAILTLAVAVMGQGPDSRGRAAANVVRGARGATREHESSVAGDAGWGGCV